MCISPPTQLLFVSVFHLCWIQRFRRSPFASPHFSTSQTSALPTCRPKAGSTFRIQNVSEDFFVSHCLGCSCRCPIKKTASISCPIRAKPVYLQGHPIVQIAADRPPNDGDTHKMVTYHTAQGKFVSTHWLVVAVMFCHKSIRLIQRYRSQLKHNCASHQLYGGLPYA
mgnify:CR=1 FL=1